MVFSIHFTKISKRKKFGGNRPPSKSNNLYEFMFELFLCSVRSWYESKAFELLIIIFTGRIYSTHTKTRSKHSNAEYFRYFIVFIIRNKYFRRRLWIWSVIIISWVNQQFNQIVPIDSEQYLTTTIKKWKIWKCYNNAFEFLFCFNGFSFNFRFVFHVLFVCVSCFVLVSVRMQFHKFTCRKSCSFPLFARMNRAEVLKCGDMVYIGRVLRYHHNIMNYGLFTQFELPNEKKQTKSKLSCGTLTLNG